jgi:adenylate kinase family enzyme
MAEFNSTFQPLVGFYRGLPNYRRVDGLRSPDEVFDSLSQLFQGCA